MSRCGKAKNLLGEYLYGEVSPRERALVERHLEHCAACREEYESCRATVAGLRQCQWAPEETRRGRVKARVAAAIERARLAPAGLGRARGRAAAAVAGALLVGCLALWGRELPPAHHPASPASVGRVAASAADASGDREGRVVVYYAGATLAVDEGGKLRWKKRA